MHHRACLDVMAKRNNPAPAGIRIPIVQPVASHYTDRAIPEHMCTLKCKGDMSLPESRCFGESSMYSKTVRAGRAQSV
jgi:hypothetical protein